MLSRQLVLAPLPPRYRDPAFPLPAATARTTARSTGRRSATTARPSVYFTLGTVFNLESGDLFARVLTGLRELPVEVVATVGTGSTRPSSGELPAHIRVERFVPQSEVLPRSSAVVSHGGSGSVLGALAHGLPQVLIPMGADQPLNADALRAARARARARSGRGDAGGRRATPSPRCSRTAPTATRRRRSRPSSPPCRGRSARSS